MNRTLSGPVYLRIIIMSFEFVEGFESPPTCSCVLLSFTDQLSLGSHASNIITNLSTMLSSGTNDLVSERYGFRRYFEGKPTTQQLQVLPVANRDPVHLLLNSISSLGLAAAPPRRAERGLFSSL